MPQRIIILFFTLVSFPVIAQIVLDPEQVGNEWIDENKTYFKVNIYQEGIYHITYHELLAAGMPVDQINGSQIELYSYGKPLRIRVSSKGVLGPNDFVEWYGSPNDGTVDALLYSHPEEEQLNPKVSLYTRERPYYLTWTDSPFTLQYYQLTNGTNDNNNPITEQYYMHRELMVFDSFHYKPTHDGRNFIRYSSMDIGEGFGTKLAGERSIEIPISELSEIGIDPRLKIRFGTNVLSRSWRVLLDDKIVTTISTGGYSVEDIDVKIPLADINNGFATIKLVPLNNNNEKHALASIELQYPRAYVFDTTSYIRYSQHPSFVGRKIQIPNYGGSDPVAYNLSAGYYLFPEMREGQLTMKIPQTNREEEWVILDQTVGVKNIQHINKMTLKSELTASDYLIFSNSELIKSGAIDDYASYRRSIEGGGYNVNIVDVSSLYDRYGYGIIGHPIAIKNYMADLRSHDILPSFVFMIGKGREYDKIRNTDQSALVPTFGVPGSDHVLLAERGQRVPDLAVGRLAAITPQNVRDYLSKIKDHELSITGDQTIRDQGWKKKILHLSGGSADIQESIFRFLTSMGKVIETNTFGADVFTFRKRSADPIKTAKSESIVTRINEGASILTFFGHSAVGTFDFSLEDPSKYSNKGRNPIILSLGCHSGNIHTSSPGISEEFVLEPDNGAIAFIASSGTAYAEPQYLSGLHFYDLIGSEMYGMPIGQILNSSLEKSRDSESLSSQTLSEQLTLHGDPAYHYQTFKGPDYLIDPASIEVQPSIINANTSYVSLNFDVVNIGTLIDEVLDLRIIHLLPDGNAFDTTYTTIGAPGFRTTISLDLTNPGDISIGANRLLIEIDPHNQLPEFPSDAAKSNNKYIDSEGIEGVSYFVFDNSAKPIYPPPYGIVGDPNLSLQASLNNGLVNSGKYVIELDTTDVFNSPFLTRKDIIGDQSLIEWTPSITWQEEKVYYWRIAPVVDNDILKANQWRSSSFVYLSGHTSGWNQSHYFQQKKNAYTAIQLQQEDRKLGFTERVWDVRIKNELRQEQDFWVFVNSTPWASLNPKKLAPALAIFIWDPASVIFNNNGNDFGSLAFSKDVFIYKMDQLKDRRNVIKLLDAVPDGARVFIHTVLGDATSDLHVEEWAGDSLILGTTIFDVLEEYGARKVREFIDRGTVPYTFVFDKGGDAVVEDIANNIEEVIDLSTKATSNWDQGAVTSLNIGPAQQWNTLKWAESKTAEDLTSLTISGISAQGKEEEIIVVTDQYEIDLSAINARDFPYLKLRYDSKDDVTKTSANLDYWRVLHEVLPDAAVYTSPMSPSIVDTLNAGEVLNINYNLRNLAPTNMAGMLVKYSLVDEKGKISKAAAQRTAALQGNQILNISQKLSTDQLSGTYQLVIEVNPNLEIREQTDCNNFGYKTIYIRPDGRNPFLDVTFNGKHIRDGEIVPEKSIIIVTLEDPGSFVLLNDHNDFDITLTYPQVFVWEPDTSSIAVEWVPATDLSNNQAQFILTPTLNLEGIYTLEVNAKDKAGNPSADRAYRVTFEIKKEENPILLAVGPNPTSDFVTFDYNLKDDRIPEIFDLYIYSTDGKLVKHVDKEDFGGLRKGSNTYRWNATTSVGEILPTGLYFYEIINSFDSRKDKLKGSVFVLHP